MKKILAKNKFLKIASLLVVVFLITTCVIGTTFAKYTTGSSGSDTAKVAKWGIEIYASGSLFGKNYGSTNTIVADGTSGITVDAQANHNVVAPGTENMTGFQIKITGKPEVAYTMAMTGHDKATDIYLNKGTYGVMIEQGGINAASKFDDLYVLNASNEYVKATGWDETAKYFKLQDAVTLNDDYYPVQWTLVNDFAGGTTTNPETLKEALATIATAIHGVSKDAGATPDVGYTLKWSWDYNSTDAEDKADTILGHLSAKTDMYNKIVKLDTTSGTYKVVTGKDYNLKVGFNFDITVTQKD